MKKFFLSLMCSLLGATFVLTSCNGTEARLKMEIEATKASCPVFVQPGLQMVDLVDEGDKVAMVYEYVDALFDFSEVVKEDFDPDYSDPDIRYLVETLVETNRNLVIRFRNKSTQETKDFIYSLEELKAGLGQQDLEETSTQQGNQEI